MRGYIQDVRTSEDNSRPIDEYSFTGSAECARHWKTRESTELDLSKITSAGITVKKPDWSGRSTQRTDYQIEELPDHRFVISCEVPFASCPPDPVSNGPNS